LFPHVSINGLQARHDVQVVKAEVATIKTDYAETVVNLTQKLAKLEKENEQLKARLAQNNLTMMMLDGKAMARSNEIEVALGQLSGEVETLKKQLKNRRPSE